ncbi:uncharacterized protein BDZ99DRAFT_504240 [Mytilinidion resinicola]|uniref:F-box domain-containing protein n=1 Tax=Mytilinidion resinicola TaxID=574789 RepID=A0A6A6Y0E9_9PEZI|nr:uncharacterized protein BDZ99DRAFT_504240 [Mytilinidion resinicola]KAF2801993.1 hypothetical protein BDZ99DRAFT_504240 [Mytilinidion resinicola]
MASSGSNSSASQPRLSPWASYNNQLVPLRTFDHQARQPATPRHSPYLTANMARSTKKDAAKPSAKNKGATSRKRSTDDMDEAYVLDISNAWNRKVRPRFGVTRGMCVDTPPTQSKLGPSSSTQGRGPEQPKMSSTLAVLIPLKSFSSSVAQDSVRQHTQEFKDLSASVKAKYPDSFQFLQNAMSPTTPASIVPEAHASKHPASKPHSLEATVSKLTAHARQTQKTGIQTASKRVSNAVAKAAPREPCTPAKTPRSNQNKRVKVEQSHNSTELPTTTTPTTRFPLMSLPTEIRLMIYEYLVPDKLVPSSRTLVARTSRNSDFRSLRHDGDKCYPALLRSSKLVNAEASYQFFKSAVFQMKVQWNTITFLQHQHNEFSLPSSLAHVKHLHIFLELTMASVGGYSGGPKPANELENAKQQQFLRMRSNLQSIGTVLANAKSIRSLGIIIVDKKLRDDDVLTKSLPAILDPFRGLVRGQKFGLWFDGDYRRFQEHLRPGMNVASHTLFTAVAEEICPNVELEVGLQWDMANALRLLRNWIQGLHIEIPEAKRSELLERAEGAANGNNLDNFKKTVNDTLDLCHAWVQAEHNRLNQRLPNLWAQSGKMLTMNQQGTPKYIGKQDIGSKELRKAKEHLFLVQKAVFDLEVRAYGHKLDYSTPPKEGVEVTKKCKEVLAESKIVAERLDSSLAHHGGIFADLVKVEKKVRHASKIKRARIQTQDKLQPL